MVRLLSYVVDGRLAPRPPGSADHAVRAIEDGVDVLAGQGTGMDAGPYYLGSDEVLPMRRKDVEPLILAAKRTGTPFVFSFGGAAGADLHFEAYLTELGRIAADNRIKLRVAAISGEMSKDYLKRRIREGAQIRRSVETRRLPERLTEEDVDRAARIQVQMGPEPIMAALAEPGIDGVVTGRALDLGVLAAYPLTRGIPKATAAHLAKVVECGTMCAEPADPFEAVLAEIEEHSFTVTCPNPRSRLTVRSVATHSLYERENPFEERNPGGVLDVGHAVYEQADDRTVNCTGASWRPVDEYTVKVEAAERIGYQAGTICGIRDSAMIGQIDLIIDSITEALKVTTGDDRFRVTRYVYGRNGVLGDSEPLLGRAEPHEVGLLLVVTAATLERARELATIARTRLIIADFPGRRTTAGNVALPLQSAAFSLGPAYVFNIWHLLPLDDPVEPFPCRVLELG